jgi:hypothetical protein
MMDGGVTGKVEESLPIQIDMVALRWVRMELQSTEDSPESTSSRTPFGYTLMFDSRGKLAVG